MFKNIFLKNQKINHGNPFKSPPATPASDFGIEMKSISAGEHGEQAAKLDIKTRDRTYSTYTIVDRYRRACSLFIRREVSA